MSRALFGRVATAVAALVAAAVVVLPGSASVPSADESSTVQTAAQRQPETALSSAAAPQKYVALGSSYAAGPGGLDSNGNRCLRTMDNYPHQVAQAMNMSLVDATCSGATTENILDRPQRFVKQPQIDAVTPGTALVTITTGGNDIGYVQRLIAMGCKNSVADPVKNIAERVCGHGRPISPEPGFERYAAVEQKMIETVFAVRRCALGPRPRGVRAVRRASTPLPASARPRRPGTGRPPASRALRAYQSGRRSRPRRGRRSGRLP